MENHGLAIKKLKEEVHQLKKQISMFSKTQETFTPLPHASQSLGVTPTVLRNRCRNGQFKYGIHFKMNGRNFLINIVAVDQFFKDQSKG